MARILAPKAMLLHNVALSWRDINIIKSSQLAAPHVCSWSSATSCSRQASSKHYTQITQMVAMTIAHKT